MKTNTILQKGTIAVNQKTNAEIRHVKESTQTHYPRWKASHLNRRMKRCSKTGKKNYAYKNDMRFFPQKEQKDSQYVTTPKHSSKKQNYQQI